MFERLKYTFKAIFTMPKPKIEETDYFCERKSFNPDYAKYKTKRETFTQVIWSIALLIFLIEAIYIFWLTDTFYMIKWMFIGCVALFNSISIKNNRRVLERLRERAKREEENG